MRANIDFCTTQIKRLGSYPGYPKNNGTALLELAKQLNARCANTQHAESAINAVLESDRKNCPSVFELSVYIDQTRSSFVKQPDACGNCIDGWVHVFTLNSMNPETGRFKTQIITKQQHDTFIGKDLKKTRQQIGEAVKQCTCERGQLALANQQKYVRDNESLEF